ncbi:MAG: site-specific integrase [Nanoarchaeota archaeon]|nr:site-specific integrase [Nanoarchaeota archaeon]
MTYDIPDIHNTKRKFETTMSLLEKDRTVSRNNKEIIKKFIMTKSYAGFSIKIRHIYTLMFIARHLKKDFQDVTNGELHKLFYDMSSGKITKKDGTPYKSLRYFKKSVRELYIKIIKKKRVIEGIKTVNILKDLHRKDFWTRDEILSFPSYASNLMDKALTSLLILGGNISEYGRLFVSDIEKADDYLIVSVRNSKNKHRTRTVYMYENNVHIINWIDSHPLKDSKDFPNVPLFIVKWKDGWKLPSYNFFSNHVSEIAKKVNSDKPPNTHIFRNSVAFWKYQNGMHDLELNRSMGWALGSNMKARYIRCDDEGVMNEELRIRGLINKVEKKKDELISCLRCQTKYTNPDLDKSPHCSRCGFTMNPKLREEEMLRRQDNMNLYAKAIAFTDGDNRDKLTKLQDVSKTLSDVQKDEIRNIVVKMLNESIV